MSTSSPPKRWQRDPETGRMMDTQMDPKVLKAQQDFEAKYLKKRATPEDTRKIHKYLAWKDDKS